MFFESFEVFVGHLKGENLGILVLDQFEINNLPEVLNLVETSFDFQFIFREIGNIFDTFFEFEQF